MNAQHDFRARLRRYLWSGLAAVAVFGGGAGVLMATIEISGAVIAAGSVVVDTKLKKVQHPTGGVVGEIHVREGDRVAAGQLLFRLDRTILSANLGIITKELDQIAARIARLSAERDGHGHVAFPPSLSAGSPAVREIVAGEESLFSFRKSAREGQKAQLDERIAQLVNEGDGIAQQAEAKRREIELVNVELGSLRGLWAQKLVSLERMTALEREAVRMQGEVGQLSAASAQTRGRASEVALQIIQIDQELRSEVAAELRELQARVSELEERRIAVLDQLTRVDIRSPQAGVVHELAVHTVGGVVAQGDALCLIVPTADELTVHARVTTSDIDQLHPGQDAVVRLSAFNQQTTPEITGRLKSVSADAIVDPRTGIEFYSAWVTLPAGALAGVDGRRLTPGMPTEVFFQTGRRTVASYLVKPLMDQINRAFREE